MTQLAMRFLALLATLQLALPGQEWTDEQLLNECEGFQSTKLVVQLEQVAKLLSAEKQCFSALTARIHGDHREYQIKVDRLLDELSNPNWRVRENAERTLIEIGDRALAIIQNRRDNYQILEQHIRCGRILDALDEKGDEQAVRERKLLNGLVRTSLYLDSDDRLLRSLRSALGHTDPGITSGAIRSVGKHGTDMEADAIALMIKFKAGLHRQAAISALARMESDKALALCRSLLSGAPQDGPLEGVELNRSEWMRVVRSLRSRNSEGARQLLADLSKHEDPVIALGASVEIPAATTAVDATILAMPERLPVVGKIGRTFGDSFELLEGFHDLANAELLANDCSIINFPQHQLKKADATMVFLNQGSRISGKLISLDAQTVRLQTPIFGELTIARSEIQGIAFDPELDRLVGASVERDRLRLRTAKFIDGNITSVSDDKVSIEATDGKTQTVSLSEVGGILFKRPRLIHPDPLSYTRIDLVTGERCIGFVAETNSEYLALTVPLVGAVALPWSKVHRLESGVGGGAMWGFTLIADYSENQICEVDDQGNKVFVLEDIFGAWDAECLDSGNLLITEFSVSRVQEVNRKGETIWSFEDLKNPYDADRLPNGNTLITLRNKGTVMEVDHDGNVVFEMANLSSPSDADRLPNGNTIVAENTCAREFDRHGNEIWKMPMTWAVEVNRY